MYAWTVIEIVKNIDSQSISTITDIKDVIGQHILLSQISHDAHNFCKAHWLVVNVTLTTSQCSLFAVIEIVKNIDSQSISTITDIKGCYWKTYFTFERGMVCYSFFKVRFWVYSVCYMSKSEVSQGSSEIVHCLVIQWK